MAQEPTPGGVGIEKVGELVGGNSAVSGIMVGESPRTFYSWIFLKLNVQYFDDNTGKLHRSTMVDICADHHEVCRHIVADSDE